MIGHEESDKGATVVVGIDGSAEAEAALRWAVEEARLRNVPLRAVHAWTLPATGAEAFPFSGGSRGWLTAKNSDFAAVQRAAEELLEAAIEAAAGGIEDIEIERRVVEGYAADVILGSVDADLLVVGSRGHGALAGALLDSVSAQCVRYAPCPVVVVHGPKESSGARHAPARTETPVAA